MKTLIKEAELIDPKYMNHSIRKTCLITLDETGIEGRHMMYLSSHKSERTIKEYTNKVPEIKKNIKCMVYLLKTLVIQHQKLPSQKQLQSPQTHCM